MKGRIEIICGPMFAGKTEELIRRIERARIAKVRTMVFKHMLDRRYTQINLFSHSGREFPAIPVSSAIEIYNKTKDLSIQVIGIDEVQFFNSNEKPNLVEIVQHFVEAGKRVILSGLDMDFRGLPFGLMPYLLAIAEEVTKLTAVCVLCGNEATHTQRLINGKPASFNSPTIIVGGKDSYQARCRNCYEAPRAR